VGCVSGVDWSAAILLFGEGGVLRVLPVVRECELRLPVRECVLRAACPRLCAASPAACPRVQRKVCGLRAVPLPHVVGVIVPACMHVRTHVSCVVRSAKTRSS
jgi:hypothetical protein